MTGKEKRSSDASDWLSDRHMTLIDVSAQRQGPKALIFFKHILMKYSYRFERFYLRAIYSFADKYLVKLHFG